jgi:hypothetical protein
LINVCTSFLAFKDSLSEDADCFKEGDIHSLKGVICSDLLAINFKEFMPELEIPHRILKVTS